MGVRLHALVYLSIYRGYILQVMPVHDVSWAFEIAKSFIYFGPPNADLFSGIEPLEISYDETRRIWKVTCIFTRRGAKKKATMEIDDITGKIGFCKIANEHSKPIKIERLPLKDRLEILEMYTLPLIKGRIVSLEDAISRLGRAPNARPLCRAGVISGSMLLALSAILTWLTYIPPEVGVPAAFLCALMLMAFFIGLIRS